MRPKEVRRIKQMKKTSVARSALLDLYNLNGLTMRPIFYPLYVQHVQQISAHSAKEFAMDVPLNAACYSFFAGTIDNHKMYSDS